MSRLGLEPRAIYPVLVAKPTRITETSGRGDLQSCLSWQRIQSTQGLLSGLFLAQIGEALNTRFDPTDGPVVGRHRLFDQYQDCLKCFIRPLAWIVINVLTILFQRLVAGRDDGL